MTEIVTAQQQRAADIAEIEAIIAAQERRVAEMKAAGPQRSGADPEDHDYEVFQEERYLGERRTELEELRSAPIVEEVRTRSLAGPAKGLAVVVGHSAKGGDPGAVGKAFPNSVAGEMRYEVHWNEELAQMILAEAKARQLPCEIFRRDTAGGTGVASAYRAVTDWGPRATLELHFNSYDGSGHGTETLFAQKDCRSWAQKLQEHMLGVYVPAAKAKGIERRPAAWQDRRVKDLSGGGRGAASLTKLDPRTDGPSALIEPFFGDNVADAAIAQETKPALARAVVDAYADWAGIKTQTAAGTNGGPIVVPPVVTPPTDVAQPVAAATKPDYFSDQFWGLLQAYGKMEIEFPQLRTVTFAQWALETGYGTRSELAKEHLNFGGMKYRPEMAPFSTPVKYKDWQGKLDDYCKFDSYENFIKAYWKRLDVVSAYKGWRNHTATKEDFIGFIGPIWAPASDNNVRYEQKVLDVHARLEKAAHLPKAAQQGAQPGPKPGSQQSGTSSGTGPGSSSSTGTDSTSSTSSNPELPNLVALVTQTVASSRKAKDAGHLPERLVGAIDGIVVAGSTLIGEANAYQAGTRSVARTVRPLADLVQAAELTAEPMLRTLAALLDAKAIEARSVKLAILAQWALESDWGRSDLARIHYNFAGIEWDSNLDDLAGRVSYRDKGHYCRFDELERFAAAYWRRLEPPTLAGWSGKATAREFLALIAPIWRPNDPGYAAGVMRVVARLEAVDAGGLPMDVKPVMPPPTTPTVTSSQPGTASPPMSIGSELDQGIVVHVKRSHMESRSSGVHRTRTVGTYSVLFNGQPLPGLEGQMYEQKGPGNNGMEGRNNAARIEAGRYPLSTQAGSKYKTVHYSATASSQSYPKPGILVGNTDKRVAILLHPGVGFLSSIGCLNFSKPLGPRGSMDWRDSFTRTVNLIEAMRDKLGDHFPDQNGKPIPNAWLVVEGEPMATRSLLEARSRGVAGQAEVTSQISDEMLQRLRPKELFDLMADSISGQVLPNLVDRNLFERALKAGGYTGGTGLFRGFMGSGKNLVDLRGPAGETLWQAWAQGWQASERVTDQDDRRHIQSELEAIAKRLQSLGLDVNAAGLFQTPLTAAATVDAAGAVTKLISLGAKVEEHDPMGNTPLVAAAFFGSEEAVAALLAAKASPSRRSLSEQERNSRQKPPADGTESAEDLFAETPPASATPLEAAKAGQAMLADVTDTTGDGGLAASFAEIIDTLGKQQ